MKAVLLEEDFGIDHVKAVDMIPPEADRLGPHDVLVDIKATSLNFRDWMTVTGRYNPNQPLPLVPLSDGAGQVLNVGEAVTEFAVGDRVAACFFQNWDGGAPPDQFRGSSLGGPLAGMWQQQRVFSEQGLVHVPAHLSDVEAATLPCAALTAWSALVDEANVKAGQTVLIQGSGGVSIFALQFAVMMGARPIVTSSSDEKLARMKEMGAWATINYKTTPQWSKQVKELTDGRGVDVIVEVGGAGTLEQSLASIAFGGTIAVIGVLSGLETPLSVIPVLMNRVRVQGIYVGPRQSFMAMNRAIAAHQLIPVVDRVFDMTEAQEALAHMESGKHFGKICTVHRT